MEEIILIGKNLYNKIATLKVESIDKENWLVFYLDIDTGEKWVKEYPDSSAHGGRPPKLRYIKNFPWEKNP
jgi:hypothetical protein